MRGKRIGTVKGSQGEFCLFSLLIFNKISSNDVQVVYLSPSEQVEAIKRGDIDAAVSWEYFCFGIKGILGSDAVSLAGAEPATIYSGCSFAGMRLLRNDTRQSARFLSALLRAEDYAASNEAEAKTIIAKRLGVEMRYMESIWSKGLVRVGLPQALLLTMEEQARWAISAGLTKRTEVPDFLDFIYRDGLNTLRPGAVSIIH